MDITKNIIKSMINIVLILNILLFFLSILILLIEGRWGTLIIYFVLFSIALFVGYTYKSKME